MITALKGTFPVLSCQRTSEPSLKTLLFKLNRTEVDAARGLMPHALHERSGFVKAIMKNGDSRYLKMTAFWEIAPCSLVEVDRRFRGAYCLHHQGDVS
jgi:hypothetical protein